MFDFEEFTGRARPPGGRPFVTLQKRGNLAMNRAAFDALGRPAEVRLLFDRGRRVIGIAPSGEAAPHAYRMRKQQRSDSYSVAGQAFTGYYGIETGTTRRYIATMHGDTLVVDLNENSELPVREQGGE